MTAAKKAAPPEAGGRCICIHGHFYQPPRESPWLEEIQVQDSAAPFHDWNQRICSECYAPNTQARILDGDGRVRGMINNFEWISFNVGPTLLAWMERYASEVLERIIEADARSVQRCGGHGNAIAQGYNHAILPLASPRDKEIQVRWGIEAFRSYFGREPEGFWLPEAAVDTASLEVLAAHGIRYTLLSPRQAKRFRRIPDGAWAPGDGETVDSRRPYLCHLPGGKRIVLFFYDGALAQEVAFQKLLDSGEGFLQRLLSRFEAGRPEPQLVHFATDGETFGHHHRFGEMALAYFLSHVEGAGEPDVAVCNYGEFLERYPPRWEAEIVEESSWSCAHGVERWRSDCGCRLGGGQMHQRWRAPLREAMDGLKAGLDAVFEAEGRALFPDPAEALDAYIKVLLHRSPQVIDAFFFERMGRAPTEGERTRGLKLLEMQRNGELMFTSCAWFFDEISGIESVQVLKYAARAIQIAENNFGVPLREPFLARLEKAPSNDPRIGNGRRLWQMEVEPDVIDLERVLAHFAVSRIFRSDAPARAGFAYSKEDLDFVLLGTGPAHFSMGAAEIVSHVTLQKARHSYAVVHFGGLDVQFFWKPYVEADYRKGKADLVRTYERASVGAVYQKLLDHFGRPTHELRDLFLDEQRTIIDMVLRERVDTYRLQFGQLFDQDRALLGRLGLLRYPIPEPMRMAATVASMGEIREIISAASRPEDLQPLSVMLEKSALWGYRPAAAEWERFILAELERRIEALRASEEPEAGLRGVESALEAAEVLGVKLNLWNAQNRFVEVCRDRAPEMQPFRKTVQALARRLLLSPEVLPLPLR